MRIDLENNDRRPVPFRVALALVQRFVGVRLGPLLMLSYQRGFIAPALQRYIGRGVAGGAWSKGEAELFASFVSTLNDCRF